MAQNYQLESQLNWGKTKTQVKHFLLLLFYFFFSTTVLSHVFPTIKMPKVYCSFAFFFLSVQTLIFSGPIPRWLPPTPSGPVENKSHVLWDRHPVTRCTQSHESKRRQQHRAAGRHEDDRHAHTAHPRKQTPLEQTWLTVGPTPAHSWARLDPGSKPRLLQSQLQSGIGKLSRCKKNEPILEKRNLHESEDLQYTGGSKIERERETDICPHGEILCATSRSVLFKC